MHGAVLCCTCCVYVTDPMLVPNACHHGKQANGTAAVIRLVSSANDRWHMSHLFCDSDCIMFTPLLKDAVMMKYIGIVTIYAAVLHGYCCVSNVPDILLCRLASWQRSLLQ